MDGVFWSQNRKKPQYPVKPKDFFTVYRWLQQNFAPSSPPQLQPTTDDSSRTLTVISTTTPANYRWLQQNFSSSTPPQLQPTTDDSSRSLLRQLHNSSIQLQLTPAELCSVKYTTAPANYRWLQQISAPSSPPQLQPTTDDSSRSLLCQLHHSSSLLQMTPAELCFVNSTTAPANFRWLQRNSAPSTPQ